MTFFSHGAASVEDTTIARHVVALAALVDRKRQFRTVDDIRNILANRATQDRETRGPLLNVSSDAHALRRYVDDSWNAASKMINGIRLWCVDASTGQIIHIGGEYTWGDCREVAALFRSLAEEGILPSNTDYGEGVVAQTVLLTDGIEWIRTHLAPVMPENTLLILDFYHVTEHLAKYAAARFGANTKGAWAWYERVRPQLFGKRKYTRKKSSTRKSHKKTPRQAPTLRTVRRSEDALGAGNPLAWELISEETDPSPATALAALLRYIAANEDRMDYPQYRERGMQIGSGAMESLHRIASQMRLKLAGARWLAETALAVLRTRMMQLADRWNDFWDRDDLCVALGASFNPPPAEAA